MITTLVGVIIFTLSAILPNHAIESATNHQTPAMKTTEHQNTDLREAAERFLAAADRGDVATLAATYTQDFMNVRVADEGGFVQLSRAQMLAFWQNAIRNSAGGGAGTPVVSTQKTTIHHVEVLGDTGFVLLTRIKNIGNGWEPMFYNLVWKKQDSEWKLLREFVHQKSVPRQSPK